MYFCFQTFSVEFDPDTLSFQASCDIPDIGTFIRDARIQLMNLERSHLSPRDFSESRTESTLTMEDFRWKIIYSGGPVCTPELEFGFRLDSTGIHFFCGGRAYVMVSGLLQWGKEPEHSTFSIRTDSQTPVFHTASGPATAPGDNGLFDRQTDRLLTWSTAGTLSTYFDWSCGTYAFSYTNGLDYGREVSFRIQRNYCAEKFHIPYTAISKKHGFTTPPVGWMTWYAIQFEAGEKTVLENAEKFGELFGSYCEKPVIWVDWEWCHRCWDGQGEEGCDIFHPRTTAYPNGLKTVADQLKQQGFIPALWIGATNEGRLNPMLQSHPDWVLGKLILWCGQWWIDPSHPEVITHYIPAVFRQILDWGYQVIKWDCLPGTLQAASEMHDHFYDRSLSPTQALRKIVRAARETVGDEVYMLSCAGDSERDICCAMDLFNAARIGGDIFSWSDFLEQGINRVMHCYPWHNTVFYADADNLILRPELSTPEQARTRVSFYGLAGLPVTLGDQLSSMNSETIHMLRRIMPVADIHPTELDSKRHGRYCQITNLAVARPFANWNVAGISNLSDEKRCVQINLQQELRLIEGRFAVFDYWKSEYLGIFSKELAIELAPFDTRVLRITPLNATIPTLLSISRHITQGAYELQALEYSARKLSGRTLCVAGELCLVTILLPENVKNVRSNHPLQRKGQLIVLELSAAETGAVEWYLEY